MPPPHKLIKSLTPIHTIIRPAIKKRVASELVTQELVQDLLKIFLRNPYLKRPHIMITDKKTTFIVDRTWYMVEDIAKSFPPLKELELHEYWVEPKEATEAQSVTYENVSIEGNEARKLNDKELQELFERTISSPGALFLMILGNSELKLFIPLHDELEWN